MDSKPPNLLLLLTGLIHFCKDAPALLFLHFGLV